MLSNGPKPLPLTVCQHRAVEALGNLCAVLNCLGSSAVPLDTRDTPLRIQGQGRMSEFSRKAVDLMSSIQGCGLLRPTLIIEINRG
jgi:hypothetical protein